MPRRAVRDIPEPELLETMMNRMSMMGPRMMTTLLMFGAAMVSHAADLGPAPAGSTPAPTSTVHALAAPAPNSALLAAQLHGAVSAAATPVVERHVANGKACAALVRATLLDKPASAQLRCILEGPPAR